MKPLHFILVIALSAATSIAAAKMMHPGATPQTVSEAKESLAARIERTKTIRCGYVAYTPFIIKDPNTGQLSGIFHELTEKLGEAMKLKIEWVAETSFATYVEDMRRGKYDVYCGGLWPMADVRDIIYTAPVFYSAMGVFVRGDDTRFDDGNWRRLNDPQYKVANIDGEMSAIVQNVELPKATPVALSHFTEISALALEVTGKKADATIIDFAPAYEYLAKNPGALKNIAREPVRIFENVWSFPKGELELQAAFNTAVKELIYNGAVERTLVKYEKHPGSFYRLSPAYQPQ
ncbi:MAG: substrate-binding periplasmic protein [Dongiaceae bacterium]